MPVSSLHPGLNQDNAARFSEIRRLVERLQAMKVLLWGFYGEGNLGDDFMAIMIAELVRSLGFEPTILSANPRFRSMGYDAVARLEDATPNAIILAGGAFLKTAAASKRRIEDDIEELARFVEKAAVPVAGVSLGSDGIDRLEQASPPRRAVVNSRHFTRASLRLRQDLPLGLREAEFLPDIVLAARYFGESVMPKASARTEGSPEAPFLINLSRRSAMYLPMAFWLGRRRGKAFFLAHSGQSGRGGEIAWPILPRIETDDLARAIDTLGRSEAILSSKLHPGMMALSMGRVFHSIALRPKTRAFIDEYSADGIIGRQRRFGALETLTMLRDLSWQRALWDSYRDFIARALPNSKHLPAPANSDLK